MITNIKNITKIIFKNVLLNLKFLVFNIYFFYFLILCSILPVLCCIVFVPIYIGGGLTMQLTICLPIMIFYGALTYNFKHSTLYRNLKITKNFSSTFYISSYISLNLIGIFEVIFSFSIFFIFNQFNLLQINWFTRADSSQINFFKINILDLIYSIFICGLIAFAISYFFSSLISNLKAYYLIIIIIILLTIIFGSTLNDYFQLHYRDGIEKNYLSLQFETDTYPEWMFLPTSILFPYYNVGQTSSLMFEEAILPQYNHHLIMFTHITWPKINNSKIWTFEFIKFVPYLHILFFGLVGTFFNIKNRK